MDSSGDLSLDPVDHVVRAAQRACATFSLPPDVFVAYLRDRVPAGAPWPLALRQMHTTDLYLACACARGDVRALAAFDERCLRTLDRELARIGIDADTSAEVKQDIRRRVLFGDGGSPKIVGFSGRGDLRGWVRVMAVRLALQHKVRARREIAVDDDELLHQLTAPGDPELDHAKRVYRGEFKRAFEEVLRALPDRTRTLLRQHHVDGLTIDELARLYRVHRATAARLVARARVLVLDATRARLKDRLGVPSQDLDSILRMIRSQVEVSLRGLRRRR
jgi:RNA polymerase sigma-70 factor (ECF subfamily)